MERGCKLKGHTRLHGCWAILISCCLIEGAGIGIIQNCVGLFYTPVSKALNVPMTQVTLYVTIQNLFCCIAMLFVNRAISRFKFRRLMISASFLLSIPALLMGFATSMWQFYVLGAIQGIGLAFTTSLIVPLILKRWFYEKLGTALGIASACCGLSGALFGAVLGHIIAVNSWRMAYIVVGISCLLLTMPVCIFVLRLDPADKGMQPYGYQKCTEDSRQKIENDVTAGNHSWWLLPAIVILAFIAKALTSFVSHLPTFGTTIPLTIANVSILTSLCMLGNTGSKFAMGVLADHIGAKKTGFLALGIAVGAICLMLTKGQIAVCIGSFFYGVVSFMAITGLPLIAKAVCSDKLYSQALVAMNVASYLSMSLCVSIFSFFYDLLGEYDEIFLALLAAIALEAVLIIALYHGKRKSEG